MRGAEIPILDSIAELAARSDAWIVDIWGVMHNGARAFAAASRACRRSREQGGTVLLLSNAPRPFTAVIGHMQSLGVPADAYDGGVTSGDVTRDLIAACRDRPLLHIGPDRDRGLFDALDVSLTRAAQAEVIVCSGLYDDTRETPADYTALFAPLVARGLPMICANPDIKVERGDQLIYCAGALAQAYAAMGGEVAYAGKPHLPIYDRALAEIERLRGAPVVRSRVLAIGDGVETDIRGGHAAGLQTVLIASSVHVAGGLSAPALRTLFADRPFAPIAALPALAW
jgi:HAD superfamily hydrolase (TIGR01459 family)